MPRPPDARGGAELHDLGDRQPDRSIVSSLAAARENARIIREVISADMWERINYYHLWMQGAGGARALRRQPQRVLQPDQAHQPADPRHRRRHDVARRGVGVLPAGQVPGTGLPDGPHPRREVPHPAADAAAGRHAGRQRPLGGDPDELLRLRAVPQAAGRAGRARACRWRISSFSIRCSRARCAAACASARRPPTPSPAGRGRTPAEQAVQDLSDWLEAKGIDGLMRDGLHESLTHVVNSIHRDRRGGPPDLFQRGAADAARPPAPGRRGRAAGEGGRRPCQCRPTA